MLISSTSGIRFTTADEPVADIVERAVRPFVKKLRGKTVVIARDGRPTGVAILKQIASMLREAKCVVLNAGTTPTPTLTMAILEHKAAGGIMVSASHNPAEWNGLKFFGNDGIYLRELPQ